MKPKSCFNSFSAKPIRYDLLISLFLVIITVAVYWQVTGHDFISLDTPSFLIENPHVNQGVTLTGITRAFFSFYEANWIPLVWLSYMIDCQLHGLDPGWHHFTNLIIHVVNVLLLFFTLKLMTRQRWPAAFVAILFALHPIHAASVAWVAERKGLLSGLFFMLSLGAYFRYTAKSTIMRFLPVMIFHALGLMSKPVLVTFPCVLLLLDYWPLHRFNTIKGNYNPESRTGFAYCLLEKTPLFILSGLSCIITYQAQRAAGAVSTLYQTPLNQRLLNAAVACVHYLRNLVWPVDLATPYPLNPVSAWQGMGAGLLLVLLTITLLWLGRRFRFLSTGWLWFIGTLVPMIGLVQVGGQAMADRYAYIPFIGLYIIIAWSVPALLPRRHYKQHILGICAALIISTLIFQTWLQAGYWKNSVALYRHSINATQDNYMAHEYLAGLLMAEGKTKEAIDHYSEALRIEPNSVISLFHRGTGFLQEDRINEAIKDFQEALRRKPEYSSGKFGVQVHIFSEIHTSLGAALYVQGNVDQAVENFKEALRINRNNLEAHRNLGVYYARQGRLGKAIDHFRNIEPNQLKTIAPLYINALFQEGVVCMEQGKLQEASICFRELIRIHQRNDNAHVYLGVTLARLGKVDEAIKHFQQAILINPRNENARYNLDRAISIQGGAGSRLKY